MPDKLQDSLKSAEGIRAGRSVNQERAASLLEALMDIFGGATGMPGSPDTSNRKLGEVLGAGLPLLNFFPRGVPRFYATSSEKLTELPHPRLTNPGTSLNVDNSIPLHPNFVESADMAGPGGYLYEVQPSSKMEIASDEDILKILEEFGKYRTRGGTGVNPRTGEMNVELARRGLQGRIDWVDQAGYPHYLQKGWSGPNRMGGIQAFTDFPLKVTRRIPLTDSLYVRSSINPDVMLANMSKMMRAISPHTFTRSPLRERLRQLYRGGSNQGPRTY